MRNLDLYIMMGFIVGTIIAGGYVISSIPSQSEIAKVVYQIQTSQGKTVSK